MGESPQIQKAGVLVHTPGVLTVPIKGGEVHPVHRRWIPQVGERPQHQPVEDPEHRGIGPDAEPEGENDGDGEGGRTTKAPQGVAGVPMDRIEPGHGR